MKRLVAIIQFMTRIPIKLDTGIDEDFHKGLIYFPVVGMLLGIIYYIIALITSSVLPTNISSILVVIGQVVLTGGLHLDGVGDSFDGLYSYRDKDRILEIMKDSRLGTNGMVAIVIVIILKISLTNTIIDSNQLWMISVMPVIGRTIQVFACYKTKTPRANGMGNMFIGKITLSYLAITTLNMIIISGLLTTGIEYINYGKLRSAYIVSDMIMVLAVVTILIVWVRLFILSVYKKIDGITGDILGCILEVSESIYLLLMVILINNR